MYAEFKDEPVMANGGRLARGGRLMLLLGLVAMVVLSLCGLGWSAAREIQGARLGAPSIGMSRMALSRPCPVASGLDRSVSADATYVMWKGAKKKMMKRPKKSGYDARRTAPIYDQLPKAPPQVVVVKAAK
eukprot:CAMPEP_0114520098 /NCGR_PEP_ID=MMETSP0109-20121206/19376_1 /TAXON_ID=29199 /ORGANISM="Chlorarachnion reptans, Strain CCCM449" /LENGTH=130 /DNA_ID=CAMNT_0001700923 /DNA_START=110 /DNA_END=502 /DNA_ORIENTATION=+